MALTSIGDRLTPSVPIEITFDSQTIATGTKITTLIGHMAAVPGTGLANQLHEMVSIGDPDAAQAEADLFAGAGSEIGKMAYAFVAANALAGRSTFPAFRILILANSDVTIAAPAIEALKHIRSDMIVSPYPASNAAAAQLLLNLAILISGPDRDLQGQFGSFVMLGSVDSVSEVQAYNYNSQLLMIASMPDSNDALVTSAGDTVSGSPNLANVTVSAGIYPGAAISGAGIPAGAQVLSVSNGKIVMSANATATAAAVALSVQNSVSQTEDILAAAQAGAIMASVFPYNPLKGVEVGGLIPPAIMSDRVQIDPQGSSEALLVAGVSPMYVLPGNVVGLLKTRTTYKLLPDGVTAVTDYNAWQQLVTLNDFREELYQICENPPFNNNPGGTKASLSVANALLGEFVRLALKFEDEGAFQGVKSLAKQFQVAPSTLRRGRFDFRLPVNVLPDLDVIAINIFSTTMFDFSL